MANEEHLKILKQGVEVWNRWREENPGIRPDLFELEAMTERQKRNPYEILQVSPNAEPEVIEAAYRRLARKYHPDVDKTPDATVRMQLIKWAYEILRDPDRRREYGRNRHSQERSQPSSAEELLSEQNLKQTTLGPDKSCHCWRCGYEWISRKERVPPAVCPRCRSDNWSIHRRFQCQDCGHTFASGYLHIPAYRLFPTCPACNSSSWHKQEEERKRQEEERREQEEKRRQELNTYLEQVKSLHPQLAISIIRFLILLYLLSVLILELASITDDTLQPKDILVFTSCSIVASGLIILISDLYPKKVSINSHKLTSLLRTEKINKQEAEWIKEQILGSKPDSAKPAARTPRAKYQKTKKSSTVLEQLLIGIAAAILWLCIKIVTGVIRIAWKILKFPFQI